MLYCCYTKTVGELSMVFCGIDDISKFDNLLNHARLGVLTNPTGVDCHMRPSYEVLLDRYHITTLLAPEHGIRGDAQAGDHIDTQIDPETGLTVFSLYGASKHPTEEMLQNIDILIFDIQDVGARCYTYLYALTRCMQACARWGKGLVVLDRPNPIGGMVTEGICLDESLSSLVGEYAIPLRYGLTIGEFATYINAVKNIGCDLTIVPCQGWKRDMWFDETGLPWVLPSPNLPTPVESTLHYLASCNFEGANVSEGRGTTRPFELVGAPYLDNRELERRMNAFGLPGVHFRRCCFTPTFEKYKGERCFGVQLHLTDRNTYRPVQTGLYLFQTIRELGEENFKLLNEGKHLSYLYGGREIVDASFSPASAWEIAKQESADFAKVASSFHLYE